MQLHTRKQVNSWWWELMRLILFILVRAPADELNIGLLQLFDRSARQGSHYKWWDRAKGFILTVKFNTEMEEEKHEMLFNDGPLCQMTNNTIVLLWGGTGWSANYGWTHKSNLPKTYMNIKFSFHFLESKWVLGNGVLKHPLMSTGTEGGASIKSNKAVFLEPYAYNIHLQRTCKH